MDSIREAGRVHYQNASPWEKERVRAMFKTMDVDDNGRISERELLACEINKLMPKKNISSLFAELDRDGSGSLDFYEFVTLYYANISRPVCDGYCKKFITAGLYYCCVRCWEMYESGDDGGQRRFEVCAECYSKKSYRHMHTQFLDNHVLLRSKEAKKSEKKLMDATLDAGRFYYQSLPDPEKSVAYNLFKEIDRNGDGRVSGNEVMGFMTVKGFPGGGEICNKLLEDMGMAGDSSYLSIEDVVALWYVFVMRPWCHRCKNMIPDTYYSCVTCYDMSIDGGDDDVETCDLCPQCHTSGEFSHEHGLFLDNFVLLQRKNSLQPMNRKATSSVGVGQAAEVIRRWPIRRMLGVLAKISVEAAFGAAIGAVCSIM